MIPSYDEQVEFAKKCFSKSLEELKETSRDFTKMRARNCMTLYYLELHKKKEKYDEEIRYQRDHKEELSIFIPIIHAVLAKKKEKRR